MPLEIDIKKVTRYPPEIFLQAKPVDLAVGENRVAEYVGFNPYVIAIHGVSFARYDDVVFHIDADGFDNVVRLDNLGAVKGLNFEEEIKIHAKRNMLMRITTPTAITAYQFRHKILVSRPNTLLKKLFDIPLTNEDRRLEEKYRIQDALVKRRPIQFDPYEGLERFYPISNVLTASGTLFRFMVPDGCKAVLLDLAAHRPAASGQAYINVTRDDLLVLDSLDLYCMQGLEQPIGFRRQYSLRIVALNYLMAELNVVTAGTYRVRAVVGVGRLTIPEKLRWDVPLDPEEEDLAEKLDLYDQVKAGLI